MTWHRVYGLAEDAAHLAAVQQATTTHDTGVDPDPAPFGSSEWWGAVDDGRIPTFTTEGNITAIRLASMNDWPEFEITAEDGTISHWPRAGDLDVYSKGLRAKVQFAVVKARPAQGATYGRDTIRVVLGIWLEGGNDRS